MSSEPGSGAAAPPARPPQRPLDIALPAFAAGKAIGVVVTVLTVWSASRSPGAPGLAEVEAGFARWDSLSYLGIAADGYPGGPLDTAPGASGHLWGFFPGLPVLIRVVSTVLRDATLSGVLVCAAAELLALTLLARLVLAERGGDAERARLAVWLLAVFPYAVFLTAVYTEAPFIAAATASLLLMRRGRIGAASACAALAVALRPTGLALVPALAWEHLRRRGWRPGPGLALALVPALPLGLFALYARHATGDLGAYPHILASASFRRSLTDPWTGFRTTLDSVTSGAAASTGYVFVLEIVFGLVGLGAIVAMAARRSLPVSFTLFASGVWVSAVAVPYWLSVPRYLMGMVPAFLLGSDLLAARPRWQLPVIAVSAGLLAYSTEVFASGRFLA